MLNKTALLLCLTVLFSCATKKVIKPQPAQLQAKTDTGHVTIKAARNFISPARLLTIKQAQLGFATFSGKADTKLTIGTDNHDVTLNIRIKHDAQIWVSVTAVMGIEVARALITPDSIKIINRLESTYIKQPFSFIYKFTNKQVDYKTLEALFTGNISPAVLNDTTQVDTTNGALALKGNLADLSYKLLLNPAFKTTNAMLLNPAQGQSLQVDNSNFVQTAKGLFPLSVTMSSLVNQKQIGIALNFNKTEFDLPLEFPFTIPARYSPAN